MGHYYDRHTGQLIDGNLREARKVGGLPSPTTVLSLLSSQGLLYYFRRCMWEAARTTPRQAHWTDDEDFEACLKCADEHGKAAREKGGDFHDLVQQFHMSTRGFGAMPEILPEWRTQFDAYLCWYEANVEQSLMVEEVVIGHGYAGRLDHLCLLKDGRVALTDVKTQDRKKRSSFNHYTSWALQLGAYAGTTAVQDKREGRELALLSIVVSSNDPVVLEPYQWPKSWSYYACLFQNLLAVWCEESNYFPIVEEQPPERYTGPMGLQHP